MLLPLRGIFFRSAWCVMRKYGTIRSSFWTDVVEPFKGDADAIALATYLMTGLHSNMIGLYYLPIAYIVCDTGLSEETIRKTLQVFEQVEFAYYDQGIVFVPCMAEHQCGSPLSPRDNIIQAIVRELEKVTHEDFRLKFIERYREAFHFDTPVPPKRPASARIPNPLRVKVLMRDGYACHYCHRKVPLEIDHVLPVGSGGKTDFENLVAACFECNNGKGDARLKGLEALGRPSKGNDSDPVPDPAAVPAPEPDYALEKGVKRGLGGEEENAAPGQRRPPISKARDFFDSWPEHMKNQQKKNN